MKLFSIQMTEDINLDVKRPFRNCKLYRFVSLFDGTHGIYNRNEEEAITQGEVHQKILCAIYPELRELVNEEVGEPLTEIAPDEISKRG